MPNPSEWKVEPYSASMAAPYSMQMVAKNAFDNWGGVVEYYFERVPDGEPNSGWQESSRWEDISGGSLDPDTVYGYRVRTRDERGNLTEWSVVRYAMTGQPETAEPPNWVLPYTATSDSIEMEATTSDPNGIGYIEYYFDELSGNPGGSSSGWQNSPSYTDLSLEPNTSYIYRVKAFDENGNETDWSSELLATTLEVTEEPNEPNEPNEPPELIAPVILDASQQQVGSWVHHVITARAAPEDALYFRFVCLDAGGVSSIWVPREGPALEEFDPIVPGSPAPTITREGGVIIYDVPVGSSYYLWEWQVCGSNEPTGDPHLCSVPVIPAPPSL